MDLLEPETHYRIHTFGCKVNTYDSGLLEKRFKESSGFLPANNSQSESPTVHILNTCAVTGEATQEALRTVRRLKAKDPHCKIVVTGCSAQVDTEKFQDHELVDLVIANSHKGQIQSLIAQMLKGESAERVFKSNIFKKDDLEEGGGQEAHHTRSFLKIQDGCNSFCTFCVIPFARGKSRSLTISAIRERVEDLLESGVREVVLTGVHIGDYEFGLENLIESLLLKTRVPRLRLTSLEPIELSPRLLELFSDPRLCPHFHMSIQSASTSVLSRMKRKYGELEVTNSLKLIERHVPNAFVGMDVIVGFPGEGEREFSETYERLANLSWTKIHVFPYSERPGTFAVKLDAKNEKSIITHRARRLRELSFLRHKEWAHKQLGSLKKILILNDNQGLSRDYWPVKVSSHFDVNTEYSVKIVAVNNFESSRFDFSLVGEMQDLNND